jgi:formylglycine-generating enzyme required for sulfatase activity
MMVGLRTTARFLLFLKPFSFWLNWLHPEIRTCPRQEEEMQALILPPENPNDRAEWHEELHQWRSVTRSLMRYSSASYDDPAYIWMQRCFALGFVMMFDTRFYDPVTGKFTIKTVLDQAEHDFGGYDAILLWHAYPKIGFDDRNQYDFYRDVPGGLTALRELVDYCHGRGVRVYIDYNPWDQGTRPEGQPDSDALAELISTIDADAIFLDTMSQAMEGLREKLDTVRPGVVLESEHALPIEQIDSHHASWAQSLPVNLLPGVLRNKWFERRHMQHRIKRWQRDHTEELHLALMNGTGIAIWENVFGTDVRWSARDKSILRSVLPIQRRYTDLFNGEGWEPLIETLHESIAASLWYRNDLRLWTICNLNEEPYTGELLQTHSTKGHLYYDLIGGQEIFPEDDDGKLLFYGMIRPRGIAVILSVPEDHTDAAFGEFLQQQHHLDARADFDRTPPPLVESLVPVTPTLLYTTDTIPDGMVHIPGRSFDLRVEFQMRECGFYGFGVADVPRLDLRYRNLHRTAQLIRPVQVSDFLIDLAPVTNAQFAAFLQVTGYQPRDSQRFLDHWPHGQLPTALEQHPVVYIDLNDARAYATWAKKRLPTEAEWQHAAQGFEERRYPWGMEYVPAHCNHGAMGTTTPVTAYPDGRSPFGCYDMCGNVWELTESERIDSMSRFCILKGGSFYRALGSEWYPDGGPQPNAFSAKMLLAWPGIDRCATIGFRCVADLT